MSLISFETPCNKSIFWKVFNCSSKWYFWSTNYSYFYFSLRKSSLNYSNFIHSVWSHFFKMTQRLWDKIFSRILFAWSVNYQISFANYIHFTSLSLTFYLVLKFHSNDLVFELCENTVLQLLRYNLFLYCFLLVFKLDHWVCKLYILPASPWKILQKNLNLLYSIVSPIYVKEKSNFSR